MESLETQTISQTTEDLLLQQTIQTNQSLEQIQNLLTSIQDMKSILPESIKNVIYPLLKNMEDTHRKTMNESEMELKKKSELYNSQLESLKEACYKKISLCENKAAMILNNLTQTAQKDIPASCNKIVSSAKATIKDTINESITDLKTTTKIIKRNIVKNLLFNFICAIVLVGFACFGVLYIQNYRDGSKIAEAKAMEALAEERSKFEKEMVDAQKNLEAELYVQKTKIENDAILNYKNSEQYIEDSCKNVAENIKKLKYINYLNTYVRKEDIKTYPALKNFYQDFIKEGALEYKKMK